jgi:hypothetical protein
MARPGSARFAKWLRLCPPKTRALASRLEAVVLPALASQGFERVDVELRRSGDKVPGNVIELERWSSDVVDSLTFRFDKYLGPRFQVHGTRRIAGAANTLLRGANLVERPPQYYRFWGKAWWLPAGLWPAASVDATIDQVLNGIADLVRFLETGDRGRHVSRAVD